MKKQTEKETQTEETKKYYMMQKTAGAVILILTVIGITIGCWISARTEDWSAFGGVSFCLIMGALIVACSVDFISTDKLLIRNKFWKEHGGMTQWESSFLTEKEMEEDRKRIKQFLEQEYPYEVKPDKITEDMLNKIADLYNDDLEKIDTNRLIDACMQVIGMNQQLPGLLEENVPSL